MNDWVYDCETFPNVFTLSVMHVEAPVKLMFEISEWRNDSRQIVEFVRYLADRKARMVGFNNIGFDYPILHTLMQMGQSDAQTLYRKAQAIIERQDDDDRWLHTVKPSDRIVEQIDLYKIHHFDNKARATSLKALEFNLRLDTIEDLPFKVGTTLTRDQVEVLKRYNEHDVEATRLFYHLTTDMIRFREDLCAKYPGKDWLNFNDTKIGKEYFTLRLEQAGVSCYDFGPDGRTPRQSPRPVIHLKDAILPWIAFQQPEFTRVLNWLKAQSITETKGVFTDLTATVNGFTFVFGLGGIHGSLENTVVESDDEHVIIDLDVTSYYPNLAITNGFHPEHLGKDFVAIYSNLFEQRKQYPKKSSESAMLKLALTGVYGDSNNRFSVFYDPLFTMSVTLNGQLLMCLLAERLMEIGGLSLVQINTDGVTVRVPRAHMQRVDETCAWWMHLTGLNLEQVRYRRMFLRDVNNYIGQYEDGSVKRKGAYEWKTGWHQNAGGLVIPKVAEKVLVEGAPIRQTVENWPHLHDFMLRIKVPRSSYLQWGEHQVQNTTRYYIAKDGKPLTKWMPPLAKKPDEWRRIGVESGWGVQVCNDIKDATLPVDFDYYINEIEKLTLGLA
ncbi:MAG: hypothetical protein ING31_08045 [Burkholderiales bacterium]|nr:hypothetical protein [Burkholderiales bacterium]